MEHSWINGLTSLAFSSRRAIGTSSHFGICPEGIGCGVGEVIDDGFVTDGGTGWEVPRDVFTGRSVATSDEGQDPSFTTVMRCCSATHLFTYVLPSLPHTGSATGSQNLGRSLIGPPSSADGSAVGAVGTQVSFNKPSAGHSVPSGKIHTSVGVSRSVTRRSSGLLPVLKHSA